MSTPAPTSVVQAIINGTPGPGQPLDPGLVPTPGIPAAEAPPAKSAFSIEGGIIGRLFAANQKVQALEMMILQLEAQLLGKAGGQAPEIVNPKARIGLQMDCLEKQLGHLDKRLFTLLGEV